MSDLVTAEIAHFVGDGSSDGPALVFGADERSQTPVRSGSSPFVNRPQTGTFTRRSVANHAMGWYVPELRWTVELDPGN
jgi:hypothetical protein